MTGAYRDPNDDLNPWVVIACHWVGLQARLDEYIGAIPSFDIGWLFEIEKVPREGIYKKPDN